MSEKLVGKTPFFTMRPTIMNCGLKTLFFLAHCGLSPLRGLCFFTLFVAVVVRDVTETNHCLIFALTTNGLLQPFFDVTDAPI